MTWSCIAVRDARIRGPSEVCLGAYGSVLVYCRATSVVVQMTEEREILKTSDVYMVFRE